MDKIKITKDQQKALSTQLERFIPMFAVCAILEDASDKTESMNSILDDSQSLFNEITQTILDMFEEVEE